LPNKLKFSEKLGRAPSLFSKQMPGKFSRFKARPHLFEIIFTTKTAQISGFQMKKQRV